MTVVSEGLLLNTNISCYQQLSCTSELFEVQGRGFFGLFFHREQSINLAKLTLSRTVLSHLTSAYPLLTVENQTKNSGHGPRGLNNYG